MISNRNLLLRVKQLCDHALPQFNWGAQRLDADAIRLLNEVPIEVNHALESFDLTRCIITGSKLFLYGAEDAVVGDLFIQGDRFIFNGNIDRETKQAQWVAAHEVDHYNKAITIPVGWDHFERRGVFITRASRSLLNDAANLYTAREDLPE